MEPVEEASRILGNFIFRLPIQLYHRLNHTNPGPDYQRFSCELDERKLPRHVQYPLSGHWQSFLDPAIPENWEASSSRSELHYFLCLEYLGCCCTIMGLIVRCSHLAGLQCQFF